MKILMLGWEYPPLVSGGLATATEGLINGLLQLGHEVTLVLPYFPYDVYKDNLVIISPENPPGRVHLLHDAQEELSHAAVVFVADEDAEEDAEEDALLDGTINQADPKTQIRSAQLRTAQVPAVPGPAAPGPAQVQQGPKPAASEPGGTWPRMFAPQHEVSPTHLTSHYQAKGHEPLALTAQDIERIEARLREYQARIAHNAAAALLPPFQAIGEQTQVLGFLAAEILRTGVEFDVIHAHDWMSFTAIGMIRLATRTPIIAHIHSTEIDRAGHFGNPGIIELERLGLAMADRVIAVSEYTKSVLMRSYFLPSEKIEVVHNAANEQHFSPTAAGAAAAKKSARHPDVSSVVTFVGRITFQKGPAYFVQAAQLVLKAQPGTRFRVVGTGDLLPAMRQLVWELGINNSFTFDGFLDASGVQECLASSDVFVMPSVSEPFGIVALEAIQQHIPVIISKQSGVSEVLSHVFKVDFWDTDLMADRILSLLRYPVIRKELASNAWREVQSHSWTRSAKGCEDVYTLLKG